MKKEDLEERVRIAILDLRREKHKKGYPFMINSSTLPSHQCWLEYPSGEIYLVELSKSRMDFDIVKVLSIEESDIIRKSLDLE
jgi:hypothetical protein